MPGQSKSAFSRVFGFISSTELAVALFLGIAAAAIPGTLSEQRSFYSSPYFIALLGAFGCNLACCTAYRFRSISWPVLVVHAGVIVTLAGCVVKASGFVATVNTYENNPVTSFYRWDLDQDVNLGFSVIVRSINREFYPVPLKIGVRRNGKNENLYTISTGESFLCGGYRVEARKLDIADKSAELAVYQREQRIGSYQTASRTSDLPAGFPYAFELVAYKTPKLKNEWVELAILQDGRIVAEGTSGVNSPMAWNNLALYNPRNNVDRNGIPYAGIQVVRDPGMPVVFAGLVLMGLGTLASSYRRLNRKPTWA